MGLAQKRISQEYQTTEFPKWKADFEKIVGFEIPIEVKWDTMLDDTYSDKKQYFDWYGLVYFQPLSDVFRSLCADDMGREAVKSSVKKIVIEQTDTGSPKASTFDNGELRIKHRFNTNVDNVKDRTDTWLKLIESKL